MLCVLCMLFMLRDVSIFVQRQATQLVFESKVSSRSEIEGKNRAKNQD